MVWNLRGALLKKGETESARLADFDFALRARTMRLLATELGTDPDTIAAMIAEADDAILIAQLAERYDQSPETMSARHDDCRARAHAQLVAERVDPSPHRLA